jgi:hypothetical protein
MIPGVLAIVFSKHKPAGQTQYANTHPTKSMSGALKKIQVSQTGLINTQRRLKLAGDARRWRASRSSRQ